MPRRRLNSCQQPIGLSQALARGGSEGRQATEPVRRARFVAEGAEPGEAELGGLVGTAEL